jgi:hypothetical protein
MTDPITAENHSTNGTDDEDVEIMSMSGGAIGTARADAIDVSQGAVGAVRADAVDIDTAAVGIAIAREASVDAAIVGPLIAREAHVDRVIAQGILAQQVEVTGGALTVFLVAQRVEGSVRTVFDWRGAIAFGAAFGIVAALLRAGRRG